MRRTGEVLAELDPQKAAEARCARAKTAREQATALLADEAAIVRLARLEPRIAAEEILRRIGYMDQAPGLAPERAQAVLAKARIREAVRVAHRHGDGTADVLLRLVADLLLAQGASRADSIGALVHRRLGPLVCGRDDDAISEGNRGRSLAELRAQVLGVPAADVKRASAAPARVSAEWSRVLGAAAARDWRRLERFMAAASVADVAQIAERSGVARDEIEHGLRALRAPSNTNQPGAAAC